MELQPVIMAGGSGSRLWPLSRVQYPKQFLKLCGSDRTMLQATVDRLKGLKAMSSPLLVCNEEHRFLASEQLKACGQLEFKILLEPLGRSTAPAITLAALQVVGKLNGDLDALILVLPADHMVKDAKAFRAAVDSARLMAEKGQLITFGVVATRPETGYGYIKCGDKLDAGFRVAQFVEKPLAHVAEGYLRDGGYLWNSGMFLFSARRYLQEMQRFAPDILDACVAAFGHASEDMSFVRVGADEFKACRADSVDCAVMEKTTEAAVIPLDAGWSDIGSWTALYDESEKDESGNSLVGDGMMLATERTYVNASSRLVATIGVSNLLVVETKDAVLIADKNHAQDVKQVVDQLRALERNEHHTHRETHRPWGTYECIDEGSRYQVKRIMVKPGAKLSLQMHHHRAEHWIVVRGTARITKGSQTYLLSENESTYIPVGEVHSLENPGKIPLELIEVQSGAYLGEDDIVRLEDRYGRA